MNKENVWMLSLTVGEKGETIKFALLKLSPLSWPRTHWDGGVDSIFHLHQADGKEEIVKIHKFDCRVSARTLKSTRWLECKCGFKMNIPCLSMTKEDLQECFGSNEALVVERPKVVQAKTAF